MLHASFTIDIVPNSATNQIILADVCKQQVRVSSPNRTRRRTILRSSKLEHRHCLWANSCRPTWSGKPPLKRARAAPGYFMDPPRRTNSSIVSSERHSSQQIQDPITATDPEPSGLRRDRMGGFVRRGHSDGEVHECSATLPRQSRGCNARERMSQSDFSSRVEDGQDQDTDPAEMVVKRRAVIMEDRRRRLSGRLDGYDRRLSFGAFGTGYRGVSCPRQSPSHTTGDEALFRPSSSPGNPFAQRIIDRPLPPRPDEELSRDRRSREISLPRWQPDEEISKCPICGNAFTFWYRKHHCRKCGRVVCANCSPHRITIPRQFIVHTPDASALNPGLRTNIGIEAVDLTSDDANESASHEERPQSSDYQIDPALGGGQEVRLCNPCVPDPNPLPHMPYPSQSYHPFEVRRQTDRIPSCRHRSYSSAQAPSPDEPSPGSGQMSSGPLEYYRSNNNAAVSPPSLDPFVQSSNRRRSHAFHSSSQAISPTQLHTVYGSAPDQPAQQVSCLRYPCSSFPPYKSVALSRISTATTPPLPPSSPTSCFNGTYSHHFTNFSYSRAYSTRTSTTTSAAGDGRRRVSYLSWRTPLERAGRLRSCTRSPRGSMRGIALLDFWTRSVSCTAFSSDERSRSREWRLILTSI